MTEVTVEELAKKLGNVPITKLIEQLKSAGVEHIKQSSDTVNEEDKEKLLVMLKRQHGEEVQPKKITLKRKSKKEEIQVKSGQGKRVVSVVTRKKRTYVKPSETPEAVEPEILEVVEEPVVEAKAEEVAVEQTTPVVEQVEASAATETVEEKTQISQAEDTATEAATTKEAAPQPGEAAKSATEVKKAKPEAEKTATPDSKKKGKRKERGDGSEFPSKRGKGKSKKDLIAEEKVRGGAARRRSKLKGKAAEPEVVNPHAFEKPSKPVIKEVKLGEAITVAELAKLLSIKAAEVIKILIQMGVMATINQTLDQDTACLVVEELGHKAIPLKETALEEELLIEYETAPEPRAPVVTVMGHVDHGKTSLLDYIRATRVTSGEAGGITQHIGAYAVPTSRGHVTFLDTPGHSAFSAMRARGAKCTDIVILVVAADDGVMPQTVEAIQHARAAEVPIVVAMNKCDKPEADIDRVTSELAQHELLPEDWGGDTMFVKVSAKTGQGIDELLEAVMLQSELLELTAPAKGPAQGVVVEAKLDRGRGSVATLLVQTGELRRGDMVLAGLEYGRVRMMINDRGETVEHVGPATPVEILGLSGTPKAGDEFLVVADERKAREVALLRQAKDRELKLSRQQASKLEGFMNRMQKGDVKVLNIVLKADVQGSLEALADALSKLSNEEVEVKIIAQAVGGFNESDINLAMASEAILIGFNVRAEAGARQLAQQEGIEFHYYSVIYDVIEGVKSAIEGRLGTETIERITGLAEVRDVFRSSKWGSIAGCMVIEGTIKRGNPIRVLRDNVVIYEGELESLRRFKDNANEVRNGMECGIGVKNYNDVKVGDQIEVFEQVVVERTLNL